MRHAALAEVAKTSQPETGSGTKSKRRRRLRSADVVHRFGETFVAAFIGINRRSAGTIQFKTQLRRSIKVAMKVHD